MEPIPETLEAIGELEPFLDDGTLLEQLRRMANRARVVAPGLVGVSIATRSEGITYTLVATDNQTAALDGIQYLTSGPCLEAMDDGQDVATDHRDLMDEPTWQAFAKAGAANGVCSTLTLPIMDDGQVVGTVNLYGAADDTFVGRHELLAVVFGAWAPGAVENADLSFSTRQLAQKAPEQLRSQARVDVAAGIVAAARNIDVATAHEQLEDAAQRAGLPVDALAEVIIELRELP